MLRLALPNKGRLADAARDLLERAGLELELQGDRALQARLGEGFLGLLVRARDIPEFVADGAADLGITGLDLVAEAGRPIRPLLKLGFGRCRMVLAAKERVGVPDIARVATSYPRIAAGWFEEQGRHVTVVPVSGAAEIAPHLGVADAIVDLVTTGSTLKMNGLSEVATIMESEAVLVGGTQPSDADRDGRIRELVAALESVLRATDKRYLMANVPRRALPELRRVLPGLSGPTVVDVMDSGEWAAAHAVVDRRDVYRVIADLKQLGAQGILVTKIERLMP